MKRAHRDSYRTFLAENRRLFLFLGLLLLGIIGGAVAFGTSERVSGAAAAFRPATAGATPLALAAAWLTDCLPVWGLLGILFLAGLSVWGSPLALAAPVFFGAGIGVGAAACAAQGSKGLAAAALLILPGRLLAAATLLPGCAESLRFSLQMARQAVSRGAHCGLVREFRMYCVRFLLFFGLAAVAGAADTLLRLLLGALF